MRPQNIPQDINAELLLSLLPQGSCKVVVDGLHKRNVYGDLIDLSENTDQSLTLHMGRHSLYDSLPEYMFHPIDRFDGLPKLEEKERFEEEYEAQEKEKENARKLFSPIDLMLLHLRVEVRNRLREYMETDKIMMDILGDEITEEQRQNRFIRQVIPFLPSCKNIRGNKTLITFMLRKIFREEGLSIQVQESKREFTDPEPRYAESLSADLDSMYVGNVFEEQVLSYTIHYWPDEEENEQFLHFIDELEVLRLFIQDYFLSVDQLLEFDIRKDEEPLRISDDTHFNYLNYNTNI